MNRFFVASWKHRQIEPLNIVKAIHHDNQEKLIFKALPFRFLGILRELRAQLLLLFTSTYPLVLSHDDLCKMNIFVDPRTGHATGIVDWAEARILPFGISLWGFENILGYIDSQGWHYYSNHYQLENLFWQRFQKIVGGVSEVDRQAIRVARLAGFFLRYGFV